MRPLILISNDDGIHAHGIEVLTRLMTTLGDVVVVAPDGPRSAQSNAITVTQPVRFKKIEEREGLARYSCSGTPTDCVKLALNEILDRYPDLLVSGINHGFNSGVSVIYSGTMGVVFEGCINKILSIGFSLDNHLSDADFSAFEPYILKIARAALKNGLPEGVCLNVNAPQGNLKGIKIARQTKGYWVKEFEKRIDPNKQAYFWMTGYFHNEEPDDEDTDEWLMKNGYVAVVPAKIDTTAYEMLEKMETWGL